MNKDNQLIFEAYITEQQPGPPPGNTPTTAQPEEPQQSKLATAGHVALDLAGLIPGVGEFADGANALWYASKGQYLNAAFSLISMIPAIGDAVGKGGKAAIYAAKGAKAVKGTGTAGRAAAKGIVQGTQALRKGTAAVAPIIIKAKNLIKANKQLIDGVFQKAAENEKLAPHVRGMQDALTAFSAEGQGQPAAAPAAPAI